MDVRNRVEATAARVFEARPDKVIAVYLFGSVARGTSTPSSDVDIGVLLAGEAPRRLEELLLDVEAEVEAELGVPVQLVVLNGAPPDLVHRVLRDGRLVLDRDPAARIRFEVRARNEFFDLEPILRRYRETGMTVRESGR